MNKNVMTGDRMNASLSDCTLCPRNCHADRTAGGRGFCGQGAHLTAARASLHFWEEPCISGTAGSGTVFFCGCNLGCVYCQNAEISRGGAAKELSCAGLSDVFLNLQEQGACNINLVTPTHFTPLIAEAIRISRQKGLAVPVVWNTSGYEKAETLRMLDGLVDIYLTDAKYADASLADRYSKAPDYFPVFQKALDEMIRQTGKPLFAGPDGSLLSAEQYNALMEDADDDYDGPCMVRGTIVRHLLLPEALVDTKRIIDYLLPKYSEHIYLSLMQQYTPMPAVKAYPELNRRIPEEAYEEAIDHALERGLENGFFQGRGTDTESFIPVFDGRGLDFSA